MYVWSDEKWLIIFIAMGGKKIISVKDLYINSISRSSTLEDLHPKFAYQMLQLEISLHSEEKSSKNSGITNPTDEITQLT